ncbi:glycosyltransferase [Pricia sp.]|uniref:glycosyltransferase n=1 Tax=Pricia sp. TaxID=2268138 RepID=UPI0035933091
MNPVQGGPCQGIRNSIPALLKLGIENEVVSFDDPMADYLGQDPFTIHALGKSKTPWGYNKKLIPWLLSHFNEYDVVIVHALWLYHSHAAVKAILAHRKSNTTSPKVYIMPHGMLDPYFQKAASRRLKAVRNEIYWKLFENKVINRSDGILFTCKEELLLARTTFPNYRPKQEINVGYGIQPPPAFQPAMQQAFAEKVPSWNGEPPILFLSRIHPKKGVDMLIKAYIKVEEEQENIPQLIIAGPGLEKDFGKEMLVLASESQNILFPGMLSGDAKWGAFYKSEAFILPSHQENFGIAVVEALACKTPVLISDKVNIWREIKAGGGGIVQTDTAEAIYTLFKEWLGLKEEKKQAYGQYAESVYKKYYTIEQAAKQFLEGIN